MLHVNVSTDFQVRNGQVLEWPPEDWAKVKQPVRVVYDDEAKAKPILRALMAHDKEIELLDVDGPRYGWMAYDTSEIRRAFSQAKLPAMEPWVLWTTQRWALDVIEKLAKQ
jgi:hypothetical protein